MVALFCYEHSTCGVFFVGWFENQFLSYVSVGVTIILDNASFHRKKKLAVIASGLVLVCCFCLLILADFNRIECRWANMKRALPDLMFGCV